MTHYETVIGLECHAQLLTQTKLFCGCRASFGAEPNTNICPVCIGLPGALPVLNEAAVSLAARMSLAVGCTVNETSIFARKNYFYPDLPKGYQISQYDRPLAVDGLIELENKSVRIERIHMEEDAGKLLHEGFHGSDHASGVDFNRSGVPLIEIVSHPDMSSPDEATAYAQALKAILEYTETSDADMEKGNFRCDGNVSIRPTGQKELGVKVELKNINSFRFLARALAYEVERQIELVERGESVVQETRLYDPDAERTIPMRSKEEAHDYRYFPEPDLPPLRLTADGIASIQKEIPELPDARRVRFVEEYQLPTYDASILTTSRRIAEFFESAARASGNAKGASNWIMSDVLRTMKETGKDIHELSLTPEDLGALVARIDDGTISGKIAKDVFEKMVASGDGPDAIIEREGLSQISDSAELEKLAREVVTSNPDQVAELKSGKDKVLGWMVGQVMKASGGKANPKLVRDILVRLVEEH